MLPQLLWMMYLLLNAMKHRCLHEIPLSFLATSSKACWQLCTSTLLTPLGNSWSWLHNNTFSPSIWVSKCLSATKWLPIPLPLCIIARAANALATTPTKITLALLNIPIDTGRCFHSCVASNSVAERSWSVAFTHPTSTTSLSFRPLFHQIPETPVQIPDRPGWRTQMVTARSRPSTLPWGLCTVLAFPLKAMSSVVLVLTHRIAYWAICTVVSRLGIYPETYVLVTLFSLLLVRHFFSPGLCSCCDYSVDWRSRNYKRRRKEVNDRSIGTP